MIRTLTDQKEKASVGERRDCPAHGNHTLLFVILSSYLLKEKTGDHYLLPSVIAFSLIIFHFSCADKTTHYEFYTTINKIPHLKKNLSFYLQR